MLSGHRRTRAHLRTALIEGPISAAAADQTLRSTFGGRWVWPRGGVVRPRRADALRAVDPCGGNLKPALATTQGGAAGAPGRGQQVPGGASFEHQPQLRYSVPL
jgi:hypothetical protein